MIRTNEIARAVTLALPTSLLASVVTLLIGSATVRGQSSDGWRATTAGNSDSYRTPMRATDTTAAGNPRAGAQVGYSLPAANAPAGDAGQSALAAPNTAYQPPLGQVPPPGTASVYPPTGNYAAPGNYSVLQNPPGAYGAPNPNSSPSDYGATLAPGVNQYPYQQFPNQAGAVPGVFPNIDPRAGYGLPGAGQPRERTAPIDVYIQESRTGRVILGGTVNSDLGVAGQVIIEERHFDWRRFSREDFRTGNAFLGGGQHFRAELMPGNEVQRYTASWTQPNLFEYLPYSLSIGGFYFTRNFRDWDEQRVGGRVALGYEVTRDLSISSELRMEDVTIFQPRVAGVADLDAALGSNDIYRARFRLARDTRDSPFLTTRGAFLELTFDQVFGEYDYSRGQANLSRYFLIKERAGQDGGYHTLASTWRFGITGSQTPVFENFFAGGYSTMRGFEFRGASPKEMDVQVGGELQFLGSLEYAFPLTADDMLRGVAFVDYGTVEQDLTMTAENFRVALGLGLRVTVPALGPAPLAFDVAYPVASADTDETRLFTFFVGATR